jgi:signal peptidase II
MKKDFIFSILIFITVVLIDQVSKKWGLGLETLEYNNGIVFGLYSHLPDQLKVIALSSMFGFIFFVYITLIYILNSQIFKLKIGLSLFTAGIFGNVLDKMLLGKSIDFIPINIGNIQIVYNLADAFQWIGVIIIAFLIITSDRHIWFPENQRGTYLINPKEQLLFALKFSVISFCASLILGIYCYTYLRVTLISKGFQTGEEMVLFSICFISIALTFGLIVFLAGVVISHRTAGPLYAFELYVEDLLGGVDRKLNLREGDNYKHLENIADNLRTYLKK